jgi:magnesium transporter
MLNVVAVTTSGEMLKDVPVEKLDDVDIAWYWIDFSEPTPEEVALLDVRFRFHPLAIEDCLQFLQRPKLDHYEPVHFFVLHTLQPADLEVDELDLFLGPRYLVTFHLKPVPELNEALAKWSTHKKEHLQGPIYALYTVIDKVVDQYFPTLHRIEDALFELENSRSVKLSDQLMDQVFEIRSDLLQLRRTIFPMRDLLYRMLNTERIEGMSEFRAYFADVYDHLLKLSEMIESNRDMTSDIRDSYISLNAHRMNTIMKTLTVITTIFMPLTFLAGIYGMNFAFMPELEMKYGYFAVLAIMLGVGVGMFRWFKSKGWFE